MNPTKKKYSKVAHLIPEVMQMKAEGKSITQIGEIMGLTKQRISQIARAAQTKADIQAQWGWPFTTRTFNILDRMAVKDKDEALSLYTSGHLHPNAVTGFGWKSYGEICEWLAVPVLLKRPKAPKLCPHCGKNII
jgi:hypothetical protein